MSDTSEIINYSIVDSKVQYPVLEKSQARPYDPILPAFMLNAADRNGLKMISIKTLRMNNYRDHALRPLTSSFGKGWTSSPPKCATPIRGRCPKIVKILTKKLRQDKLIYQISSNKQSDKSTTDGD